MSKGYLKVILSKGNVIRVPTIDGQNSDDSLDPMATDAAKIGKMASAGNMVATKVANAVFNESERLMGSYETISEDYKLGTAVQNTKTILSLAGNAVGSTLSGAMTGMQIGGPVGAAIGAALGLVSSGVKSYVNASRDYNDALTAIQKNAYSNYFQGSRSGYMDGGRGSND